jgi:hypothetical protein
LLPINLFSCRSRPALKLSSSSTPLCTINRAFIYLELNPVFRFERLASDHVIVITCTVSIYWWEGVDWNDLAEDRNKWLPLASTVMKFRLPKMRGISWPAEQRLALKLCFCSVVLIT